MRSLSSETRGFLQVSVAILLWSTAEVVVRGIHGQIAPIQLAWLRYTFGTLFLLAMLPYELRRRNLRVTRRILFHAAWLSIVGVVCTSVFYQMSLEYAGAGLIATLFGASPIMVFVLSRIFLGDPLTLDRFFGVLLGFFGILILSLSRPSLTFSLTGLALGLISALFFSLFTVFVKKLAGQYAGLPFTAICFAFGVVLLFPMALWEGDTAAFSHWRTLWLPLLYLSIGTTGVAYAFFLAGLEKVDATRAMSVILMKPPLAAILAMLVLGEPISWNLGAAIICILSGLYLVIAVRRYRIRRVARP